MLHLRGTWERSPGTQTGELVTWYMEGRVAFCHSTGKLGEGVRSQVPNQGLA